MVRGGRVDGMITQLTVGMGNPASTVPEFPIDRGVGECMHVDIPKLTHAHVWNDGDKVIMVVGRWGEFPYTRCVLTKSENHLIQDWARRMYIAGIGSFAPVDIGWCWWSE